MDENKIKNYQDTLNLIQNVDQDFRVFGSDVHQYRLNPVLTETEIVTFENNNNISLPKDYRFFLNKMGNGGAGPFYGVHTLEQASNEWHDLTTPFPFIESATDEQEAKWGYWDDSPLPGVLEICHEGCGYNVYLVVNGEAHGTIWTRYENFEYTGLSFTNWYERWLSGLNEKAIPILENEKIVAKIKIGMSKQKVIDTIGHDFEYSWIGNVKFLKFKNLVTRFELDKNEILTRIVKHDISIR